jgi:hypothetical protein
MDIKNVILEFRSEVERIDQAIRSLEQLAMAKRRGRGRPPKWLSEMKAKENRTSARLRTGPHRAESFDPMPAAPTGKRAI